MSYRFCHNKFKKGFTLVEVLLATTIVAVIAALVVPVAVTNYQKKVMVAARDKFVTGLTELIDRLTIIENVGSFSGTSLYADENPAGIVPGDVLAEKTGHFIMNNFKVEKYPYEPTGYDLRCNDPENEEEIMGCGPLALLKSGEVFCIYPQTKKHGVRACLDVNGETPPNAQDIDVYTIEYPMRELATTLEVAKSENVIVPPEPQP